MNSLCGVIRVLPVEKRASAPQVSEAERLARVRKKRWMEFIADCLSDPLKRGDF
ncbi:hypothetical protein ACFSR9_05905 [Deinococcus taklimakanensis]|uniref:Transposase n=1 Tax=Deinococcus taklimakanensis TaxID=536443 RepID=A0ABW5P422_9DEIO